MADYCPGCSRKETIIQALTDAFRVSQGVPGIALSALDLGFRNSPVPGKIMSEAEALRSWLNDYETIWSDSGNSRSREATGQNRPNFAGMGNAISGPGAKKKRKVSRYQKEFGKQLKILKRKHPRTKISSLMKRAHRATRKAMK